MAKCLVTNLKEVVNNDNLEYLGYIRVKVNTVEEGSNYAINFLDLSTGNVLTTVAGCKVLGGKTFANGKSVSEEGDTVSFAPGDTYDVLVPKYSYPIFTGGFSSSYNMHQPLSFNIDDYYELPTTQVQTASWATKITFAAEDTSYAVSGHIDTLLNLANPDYISTIMLGRSAVSGVITNRLADFYSAEAIYLNNCLNISGSLRLFVTEFMSRNTAAIKARTNTLLLRYTGSRISQDEFGSGDQLFFEFNGTSSITIKVRTINTAVIRTFNYDIDTDTLELQS